MASQRYTNPTNTGAKKQFIDEVNDDVLSVMVSPSLDKPQKVDRVSRILRDASTFAKCNVDESKAVSIAEHCCTLVDEDVPMKAKHGTMYNFLEQQFSVVNRNSEVQLDFIDRGFTNVDKDLGAIRAKQRKLVGLAGLLAALLVATFGLQLAAVEVGKEAHVVDGALNAGGSVVRVRSSDFDVVDGTLVLANDARRLGEEGHSEIRTGALRVEGVLSSTLSDATFATLKQIKIFKATEVDSSVRVNASAPSGTLLTADVHGFERRLLRTSLCGSVVHLETSYGRITLDDTVVHVAEALGSVSTIEQHTRRLTLSLGTGAELGHAWGRRLMGSASLAGFFGSYDWEQWECESQPAPVPTVLDDNYHGLELHHIACAEQVQCTSDLSSALQMGNFGLDVRAGVEERVGRVRQGDFMEDQYVWTRSFMKEVFVVGGELAERRMDPFAPTVDFVRFDTDQYQFRYQSLDGLAGNCFFDPRPQSREEAEAMVNITSQPLGNYWTEAPAEDEEPEATVEEPKEDTWVQFIGVVERDGELQRGFRVHPEGARDQAGPFAAFQYDTVELWESEDFGIPRRVVYVGDAAGNQESYHEIEYLQLGSVNADMGLADAVDEAWGPRWALGSAAKCAAAHRVQNPTLLVGSGFAEFVALADTNDGDDYDDDDANLADSTDGDNVTVGVADGIPGGYGVDSSRVLVESKDENGNGTGQHAWFAKGIDFVRIPFTRWQESSAVIVGTLEHMQAMPANKRQDILKEFPYWSKLWHERKSILFEHALNEEPTTEVTNATNATNASAVAEEASRRLDRASMAPEDLLRAEAAELRAKAGGGPPQNEDLRRLAQDFEDVGAGFRHEWDFDIFFSFRYRTDPFNCEGDVWSAWEALVLYRTLRQMGFSDDNILAMYNSVEHDWFSYMNHYFYESVVTELKKDRILRRGLRLADLFVEGAVKAAGFSLCLWAYSSERTLATGPFTGMKEEKTMWRATIKLNEGVTGTRITGSNLNADIHISKVDGELSELYVDGSGTVDIDLRPLPLKASFSAQGIVEYWVGSSMFEFISTRVTHDFEQSHDAHRTYFSRRCGGGGGRRRATCGDVTGGVTVEGKTFYEPIQKCNMVRYEGQPDGTKAPPSKTVKRGENCGPWGCTTVIKANPAYTKWTSVKPPIGGGKQFFRSDVGYWREKGYVYTSDNKAHYGYLTDWEYKRWGSEVQTIWKTNPFILDATDPVTFDYTGSGGFIGVCLTNTDDYATDCARFWVKRNEWTMVEGTIEPEHLLVHFHLQSVQIVLYDSVNTGTFGFIAVDNIRYTAVVDEGGESAAGRATGKLALEAHLKISDTFSMMVVATTEFALEQMWVTQDNTFRTRQSTIDMHSRAYGGVSMGGWITMKGEYQCIQIVFVELCAKAVFVDEQRFLIEEAYSYGCSGRVRHCDRWGCYYTGKDTCQYSLDHKRGTNTNRKYIDIHIKGQVSTDFGQAAWFRRLEHEEESASVRQRRVLYGDGWVCRRLHGEEHAKHVSARVAASTPTPDPRPRRLGWFKDDTPRRLGWLDDAESWVNNAKKDALKGFTFKFDVWEKEIEISPETTVALPEVIVNFFALKDAHPTFF